MGIVVQVITAHPVHVVVAAADLDVAVPVALVVKPLRLEHGMFLSVQRVQQVNISPVIIVMTALQESTKNIPAKPAAQHVGVEHIRTPGQLRAPHALWGNTRRLQLRVARGAGLDIMLTPEGHARARHVVPDRILLGLLLLVPLVLQDVTKTKTHRLDAPLVAQADIV